MTAYVYDTSVDEDAALDRELQRVNNHLTLDLGLPAIDLQGLWKMLASQQLQPLVNTMLDEQAAPIVQKFIATDTAGRTQLLDAAAAVAPRPA